MQHLQPKHKKFFAIGIILDLLEGSAIKFVSHRSYDKLLCNHVYQQFCLDCPQYECRRRRV